MQKNDPYQFIRSKRKTVSITVYPDAGVTVRVPQKMSQTEVIAFLTKKEGWIQAKVEQMKQRQLLYPKKEYRNGEQFRYLGDAYYLCIQQNCRGQMENVVLERNRQTLTVAAADVKSQSIRDSLLCWYRKEAEQIIRDRVCYYAGVVQKTPNRIRIKEQKSRYGSCSSKGNLNFNWKLVMAPIEIIDYVAVHELCHLEHMDHSAGFWNLVGSILPDYKQRRMYLKENGAMFSL